MRQWLLTVGGTIAFLLAALQCGERVESVGVPVSGDFIQQAPTSTLSLNREQLAVLAASPATTTSTTATTTTTSVVPVQATHARTTTTTTLWVTTVTVEALYELVARVFPSEDHEWAFRVMLCESSNRPDALNRKSGTMGLFQHHPRHWEERSTLAGIPGADPYDPESNVIVAEWLLNVGAHEHPRGPQHWECK